LFRIFERGVFLIVASLKVVLSAKLHIQFFVPDPDILRWNQDEEHARPFVALICPLVDCSALNKYVTRARLDLFAVVEDERYSALRHNRITDRDGSVESGFGVRRCIDRPECRSRGGKQLLWLRSDLIDECRYFLAWCWRVLVARGELVNLRPKINLSSRKTDFPDAVWPVTIRRTGGYGDVLSAPDDIEMKEEEGK